MATVIEGMAWFKKLFGPRVQTALKGSPFTLDLMTAVAVQETFEVWGGLMSKMGEERILSLCVGDTVDRKLQFPKSRADLLKRQDGEQMFKIARLSLEAVARHNRDYAKAAEHPDKFCQGFGIFQYDIQFFDKVDPAFFLDMKWFDFDACLGKALSELAEVNQALYRGKRTLTVDEMVYVAIGYNQGAAATDVRGGFKQGSHDSSGRFYGEAISDYIKIAAKVPLPVTATEVAPISWTVCGLVSYVSASAVSMLAS